MRSLFAFLLLAAPGSGQSDYLKHAFTLGAGGLAPVSGWKTLDYDPGAALDASYGFRFHRYAQAEAGYAVALPNHPDCGRNSCSTERKRVSLLDYGVRGILPLKRDRFQLSAGLGGGYIWNDLAGANSYRNDTLFQYSGRASAALDSAGHYRVGTTLRFWRDLGRPTQQWITVTGDFSYGFGH